jgi:endo-1,4-beta-D-glucanase Y
MAGYQRSAKGYYNGLFRYYKSHPSYINSHLMDWQQLSCDDSPGSDDDAASDGDIDIAFSLLLAHTQWGSDEDINYLAEAKTMINAIMQDEINPVTWTVKLGDWSNSGDPDYYYGTRTSDFIPGHFRVFQDATGNSDWTRVKSIGMNPRASSGLKKRCKHRGIKPNLRVRRSFTRRRIKQEINNSQ